MVKSNITYALEFSACEAEELRATGEIQAGFDVMVLDQKACVGGTARCMEFDAATVNQIASGEVIEQCSAEHQLIDAGSLGHWMRHTRGQHVFFEQSLALPGGAPPPLPDWDELEKRARGNLWKLGVQVCDLVATSLDCARVMVYRFHEDWSGEVIAESLQGELESFLGLRYPPTDIPKQARELFKEIRSRHIFATTRTNVPVMAAGQSAEDFDLTHLISRSVSPFHIEYLVNMGSASTASCGLMVDGKLWGLLSLHFSEERPAGFAEFSYLQAFTAGFEPVLARILQHQADDLARRAQRLLDRHERTLSETIDAFAALVLSETALHRMISAQGICLIIDNEACQVGEVPDIAISRTLCATLGPDAELLEPQFFDQLPQDIPLDGRGNVTGFAFVRLSETPATYLLLYRTALNQSVSWGGDPRRIDQPKENQTYSPRKSFERWVETVEGQSAPWTDLPRITLARALRETIEHFGVTPRELAILIRTGMRQYLRRPDLIRANALQAIDGIRTAIAVAVEFQEPKSSRLVALNIAAAEAFAIAPYETVAEAEPAIERVLGIEFEDIGAATQTITMMTANNGFRDCEVSIGLLFDYIDDDSVEKSFRIQVFEFRDITEARRIEKALQSARDRALRDMELRSELFDKLNHELRTPLNAIIGFSELLLMKRQAFADERSQRHVELISQASRHLGELIKATLDHSFALKSLYSDELVDTPLRPVVEEAVGILSNATEKAQVRTDIDLSDSHMVKVEPRAMRQVLLNVLENAVKYNVPGGQVDVTLEQERPEFLTLAISDTGIGMSEAALEKCMQPYHRFAPGEGAGLGLSISNHMLGMMGGTIRLDSKIGQGTIVRISLPINTRPDAAA